MRSEVRPDVPDGQLLHTSTGTPSGVWSDTELLPNRSWSPAHSPQHVVPHPSSALVQAGQQSRGINSGTSAALHVLWTPFYQIKQRDASAHKHLGDCDMPVFRAEPWCKVS